MTDLQRAHNDWLDPDSPRQGRVAEYRDEWREDMMIRRSPLFAEISKELGLTPKNRKARAK